MTERRGTKALELWCRRITDGYPGVNVQNMTTSWRDGLAFCAMIHHFRPDLIDFNSLNKDDVYSNNELAFRTAAEHLGIPALLDAEDMASCSVPDRLSILTYLSQFYQSFGGSSPSRLALSRTKESSNEGITPVVAESTTPKVGPRMVTRREPCAVCKMPVFLAEKLVISRVPYHRTCFRCARCKNQLTPGNYYETEDGEFCCETCPDEEDNNDDDDSSAASVPISVCHQAYNEAMINVLVGENVKPKDSKQLEVYQRSLSDEEKSERRARFVEEMKFDETKNKLSLIDVKNDTYDDSLILNNKISQTAQMRLSFMTNHLLSENYDETATTTTTETDNSSYNDDEQSSNESSKIIINDCSSLLIEAESQRDNDRRDTKGSLIQTTNSDKSVDINNIEPCRNEQDNDNSITIEANNLEISDFIDSTVNVAPVISEKSDNLVVRLVNKENKQITETKSFDTANEEATSSAYKRCTKIVDKKITNRQDTKDKIGPDIIARGSENFDNSCDNEESLSLVRRRLRMFEDQQIDGKTRQDAGVDSAVCTNFVERNIDVSGTTINERKNENIVEISRISQLDDNSTIVEDERKIDESNSSIEAETKDNEIIPPVVPKRSNLRGRRDEKMSVKKSFDVTILNATGIDLSAEEIYPEDLNPFGSSDDEEKKEKRKGDDSHEISRSSRISTNPFGSSEDEEEEEESSNIVVTPRPAARNIGKTVENHRDDTEENDINEAPTKRRLKAPQINLNPFWSDDDDDHESEEEHNQSLNANTPVPKPRTIRQTGDSLLSPWKNDLNRGEFYASNSSLASTGSTSTTGGTSRKKKPAPPPPIVKESLTFGGDSLTSSITYTGSNNSLRITPRGRKTKPAPPPPPPPMPTSTPCSTNLIGNITLAESPITNNDKIMESRDYELWKEPKNDKDEANRNKQTITDFTCDETSPYDAYMDKSVHGKWKRKKGPAPARPIPHRRKIKVMSLKDVKLELDEIEMQQQGLEKQGVRLEQLIRDKAETGNATEETSLGMDVEELVLELFALVNEKNELFRRQAELMLLRRQQRLEEEHADIEYQIRCLLCQPEATKTDFDKQREETLIQRLVEIVERRNEIVECLEMDRRREVEEDRSINTQMGIYAAKNKGEFAKELEDEANNRSRKTKKSKLKDKAKEKILRKVQKKDADKDVDETEVKLKRQNKKKWF